MHKIWLPFSSCQSLLLLAHHHFDLLAQQFCDSFCLQYHHPLSWMPVCVMGVEEILVVLVYLMILIVSREART